LEGKSAPDEEEAMTSRRQFLKLTLGLPLSSGGLWLGWDRLRAQEPWPTRTITLVVPFPPGGVADFAARPLAAHLSQTLGQKVVIENKGGAGGGIGHAVVARAEPDGYTIMTALPSLAVIPEGNRLQGKPVPYEMDQFVPLGARAVSGRRPFVQRAPVGPSASGSDAGVDRQRPDRCRKHPHPGAMGHRTAAELSARADAAGGRISGGRLYPLDRGVCAEEYAGARDGLSARRDPPVHAVSSRHRAFYKSWKPGFLS